MTKCYPDIPSIAGPALSPRINSEHHALMDAYAQSTDAPVRPGMLTEVPRLVRYNEENMGFCLVGFLDQFYADRDLVCRHDRIADDPGLSGEERFYEIGRDRRTEPHKRRPPSHAPPPLSPSRSAAGRG
jgi:hypothetical protein